MSYAHVSIFKKSGEFDEALTYRIPDPLSATLSVGAFVEVPFRLSTRKGIVTSITPASPDGMDPTKIRDIGSVFPTAPFPERHLQLAHFIADYYHTSLSRSLRLFFPKALWDGNLLEPQRTYVRLSDPGTASVRGTKANKLLDLLRQSGGTLPLEGLREQSGGFSSATLNRLSELGLVALVPEPLFCAPSTPFSSLINSAKPLTPDQESAISIVRGSGRPTLLYGVTGSGKTEIYLRLIQEAAAQGKQSILLVPEIALTPQTLGYFREQFGDTIAVFHSKLSDGERLRMWWMVRSGAARLVIGSRSAIFAPVKDLGLIIMDEEHEWTYKQESAPYYRTHRIAEEMAKLWDARLVLGSATPSAESFQKSKSGEYSIATLAGRIHQTEMPQIHLIDLRDEFKKRNFSIFSLLLQNKIRERLERKEQIILFVNQRGLANAVVCRDCGYTEKCPRCDIALKYHRSFGQIADNRLQIAAKSTPISNLQSFPRDRLVCHYCQFTKSPELLCPECRSPYIKHVGVGTQRVEEEAKKLFPTARVVRADRDTTENKEGFEPIYRDFLDRKHDILIGTQMVAKGLDFGNVTLIGIVLADIGLHQPDFRSSERLYQVLTQVSGRCGRRGDRGEVVLQTYNPTHPTIRMATAQDYPAFIDRELKNREQYGYPPFSRMIKFTVVGTDALKLSKHIETEEQVLSDIAKLNQLPLQITSAPASIPRISDRFYYHVLIRAEKPELLLNHWKIPKGWRIDVDPVHTA